MLSDVCLSYVSSLPAKDGKETQRQNAPEVRIWPAGDLWVQTDLSGTELGQKTDDRQWLSDPVPAVDCHRIPALVICLITVTQCLTNLRKGIFGLIVQVHNTSWPGWQRVRKKQREMNAGAQLASPLFTQSRSPAQGVGLSLFRVGFPTSINLIN